MMHPLLALIATRPQLLGAHAEAYGALVAAEFGEASAHWQRKLMLGAVALCSAGVAAVLAGTALMLWALLPLAQARAPWVLLVVPGLPALVAIVCALAARRPTAAAFGNLHQQFKADLRMLHEAGRA